MPIGLVRTAWAGTTGGPGITQLYFRNGSIPGSFTVEQATAAVNAVRKFWAAIAVNMPNEIVLTVSNVVDEYDIASGDLVDSTVATVTPASVAGGNAGTYPMVCGARLHLNTGEVRRGRRVRGGIFIVPGGGNIYSDAGTIGSGPRGVFNTAAATLIADATAAGLDLVVYSRPIKEGEKYGPRDGDIARVSGIETSEKAAVLRGRRD